MQDYSEKINEFKSFKNNDDLYVYLCNLLDDIQIIQDTSMLTQMIPVMTEYLLSDHPITSKKTAIYRNIHAKIYIFFSKFSLQTISKETLLKLLNVIYNSLSFENVSNSLIGICIMKKIAKKLPLYPKNDFNIFLEFFNKLFLSFSNHSIDFYYTESETLDMITKASVSIKTLFNCLEVVNILLAKNTFSTDKKYVNTLINTAIASLSLKIDSISTKTDMKGLSFFFRVQIQCTKMISMANNNNSYSNLLADSFVHLLTECPQHFVCAFSDLLVQFNAFVVSSSGKVLNNFLTLLLSQKIIEKLTCKSHRNLRRQSHGLLFCLTSRFVKQFSFVNLVSVCYSVMKSTQNFTNFDVHLSCYRILCIISSHLKPVSSQISTSQLLCSISSCIIQYLEAFVTVIRSESVLLNKKNNVEQVMTVYDFVCKKEKFSSEGKEGLRYSLDPQNILFIPPKLGSPTKCHDESVFDISKDILDNFALILKNVIETNSIILKRLYSMTDIFSSSNKGSGSKKTQFKLSQRVYDVFQDYFDRFVKCFAVFMDCHKGIQTHFERFFDPPNEKLKTPLNTNDINNFCSSFLCLDELTTKSFFSSIIPSFIGFYLSRENSSFELEIIKNFIHNDENAIYFTDSLLLCLKIKVQEIVDDTIEAKNMIKIFEFFFRVYCSKENVKKVAHYYLSTFCAIFTQTIIQDADISKNNFQNILQNLSIKTNIKTHMKLFSIIFKFFDGEWKSMISDSIVYMPIYVQKLGATQDCKDIEMRNLSLELSLLTPFLFISNQYFACQFVKTLIHSLKSENEKIINLCLNVLENQNFEIFFDYFDSNKNGEPIKDLMHALCGLLSGCKKNGLRVVKILGNLGGKNRTFLNCFYSIDTKKVFNNLFVSAHFKNEAVHFEFPLERIFYYSCEIIKSSQDEKLIENAFQFVRIVISFFFDFSVHCDLKNNSSIDFCDKNDTSVFDKCKWSDSFFKKMFLNNKKIYQSNQMVCHGINSIIMSLKNDSCCKKKLIYINDLCIHSAITCISSFNDIPKSAKLFVSALCDTFETVDPLLSKECLKLFSLFFHVANLKFKKLSLGKSAEASTPKVYLYLVSRFGNMCSHRNFDVKCTGFEGLYNLYENIPDTFRPSIALSFVKALFLIFVKCENLPVELCGKVENFGKKILSENLEDIMGKTIEKTENSNGEDDLSPFKVLINLLVFYMAESDFLLREFALSLLKVVSHLSGMSLREMVQEWHKKYNLMEFSAKEISFIAIKRLPGYISFTNFCLSFEPPIKEYKETDLDMLYSLLNVVVEKTSGSYNQDIKPNVYYRCEKVKNGHNIKINFFSFLATLAKIKEKSLKSDVKAQSVQIKAKLIVEILKFVDKKRNEATQLLKRVLKPIFTDEAAGDYFHIHLQTLIVSLFSEDELSNSVDPIASLLSKKPISELNSINRPKCVAKIMDLFYGNLNDEVGSVLMKYIQRYTAIFFKNGPVFSKETEQPFYAFDILQYYPPFNENFIEQLIVCAIKLDNSTPQIKWNCADEIGCESLFQIKLFAYLNRHAEKIFSFFSRLKHLSEPKYSTVFLKLLDHPSSTKIRSLIRFNLSNIIRSINQMENDAMMDDISPTILRIVLIIQKHENLVLEQPVVRFIGTFFQKKLQISSQTKVKLCTGSSAGALCTQLKNFALSFEDLQSLLDTETCFDETLLDNQTFFLNNFTCFASIFNAELKMTVFCLFTKKWETLKLDEAVLIKITQILRFLINPFFESKDFLLLVKSKGEPVVRFVCFCLDNNTSLSDDFLIELFRMLKSSVGAVDSLIELKEKILSCALYHQKSNNPLVVSWASLLLGKLIYVYNATRSLIFDNFCKLINYSDICDIDLIIDTFKYVAFVIHKNNHLDKFVLMLNNIMTKLSRKANKTLLALITHCREDFLPFRKVVLKLTINFVTNNKEEMKYLGIDFFEAMICNYQKPLEKIPSQLEYDGHVEFALQEKIFAFLTTFCFNYKQQIERFYAKKCYKIITEALKSWSINSINTENLLKFVSKGQENYREPETQSSAAESFQQKNGNKKTLNTIKKMAINVVEVLLAVFESLKVYGNHNRQLFPKWFERNLEPIYAVLEHILPLSTKSFVDRLDALFESIVAFFRGFQSDHFKIFYDLLLRLIESRVGQEKPENVVSIRGDKERNGKISLESAVVLLTHFETSFHFCVTNTNSTSNLFAEVLRCFFEDPSEKTKYLLISTIELLHKALKSSDSGFFRERYFEWVATTIRSVDDQAVLMSLISLLSELVPNKRLLIPLEQVINNSSVFWKNKTTEPELFSVFLSFVLRFFESSTSARVFKNVKFFIFLGLNSTNTKTWNRFFNIAKNLVGNKPFEILTDLFDPNAMASLKEKNWMAIVVKLILSNIEIVSNLQSNDECKVPPIELRCVDVLETTNHLTETSNMIKSDLVFARNEQTLLKRGVKEVLKSLVQSDDIFVRDIWKSIFPYLWSLLSEGEKLVLSETFNNFLSSIWLNDCQNSPAEKSVLCFLEGVNCIKNNGDLPELDPLLLLYCASEHKAWYEVIRFLERKRANSIGSKKREVSNVLETILGNLSEKQPLYGLQIMDTDLESTQIGCDYKYFEMWESAQDTFGSLIYNFSGTRDQNVTEREQILWQKEWIECTKNLNEWDILFEYGKSVNNIELQFDSSWKLSQWSYLKELTTIYDVRDMMKIRDRALYDVYVSLMLKQSNVVVERNLEKAYETSLSEWSVLPRRVCESHAPVLHNFHRIVELEETYKMLTDCKQAMRIKVLPDLSKYLSRWRKRLPNKCEKINMWHDLLQWRVMVFFEILKDFSSVPADKLKKLQDLPWTITKMSAVARKKLLLTTSLTSLAMQDGQMRIIDANNAYLKLREQIKICMKRRAQLSSALNLINSTNMNLFSSEQVSNLMALKGSILSRIGSQESTELAFNISVLTNLKNRKSWLKWAEHCEKAKTMDIQPKSIENALVCYFSALTCDCHKSKEVIPRILWLISQRKCDMRSLDCEELYRRFSHGIPLWVWVFWIPTLLNSLFLSESNIFRSILCKLANCYPQALYPLVRYNLNKLFMRQNLSGPETKVLKDLVLLNNSFGYNKEIVKEIGNVLDKIMGSFLLDPEEELLSIVNGILNKCYRGGHHPNSPVTMRLKISTFKIFNDFFTRLKIRKIKNERIEIFTKKNEEVSTFLRNQESPALMRGFFEHMHNWRRLLHFFVLHKDRSLRSLSPYLSNYFCNYVEVFGQYDSYNEPILENHYLLSHFSQKVELCQINGYYSHKLTMISQWGSRHTFAKQRVMPHVNEMGDNIRQFCIMANHYFNQFNETRLMNIRFDVLAVIPLADSVRLISFEDGFVPLDQIFDNHCFNLSLDPTDIFSLYFDNLKPNEPERVTEIFLKKAAEKFHLKYFLARHFRSNCATEEDMWVFKKQFTRQYALCSLMEHVFMMHEKFPYKKLINSKTGAIRLIESYSFYDSSFDISPSDFNFFRLTPEICRLIGSPMLYGIFVPTLVTLSACFIKFNKIWKYFLYLFVRDDVTSWMKIKSKSGVDLMASSTREKIKKAVYRNVYLLLQRFCMYMVPEVGKEELGDCKKLKRITQKVKDMVENSIKGDVITSMPVIAKPWI